MVILIQLQRLASFHPELPSSSILREAIALSSSRRFGPVNEVKERLHCQALQRLSGLDKALALFVLMPLNTDLHENQSYPGQFHQLLNLQVFLSLAILLLAYQIVVCEH